MRIKSLCIAAAAAFALAAAPAQAGSDRSTIAFRVQFSDAVPTCSADDLFGISFDMIALRGTPLGAGRSCVRSIEGCSPFTPFCRQTIRATFTLRFARGTITAPMRLREVLPTETSFIQHGKGKVAAGTGAFAGSRGHVIGGGAGVFTEQGFAGRLVYAVVGG